MQYLEPCSWTVMLIRPRSWCEQRIYSLQKRQWDTILADRDLPVIWESLLEPNRHGAQGQEAVQRLNWDKFTFQPLFFFFKDSGILRHDKLIFSRETQHRHWTKLSSKSSYSDLPILFKYEVWVMIFLKRFTCLSPPTLNWDRVVKHLPSVLPFSLTAKSKSSHQQQQFTNLISVVNPP